MTLLDFLNERDRFAKRNGCCVTRVGEGCATAQMTVTEQHLNGGDVCQGGALFTLADHAMAAVMNSRGVLTLSIQTGIQFMHSAYLGDVLTAEAVEVVNHPKIPSCEVKVSNQDGELICVLTGIAYRKKAKVECDSLM